MTSLSRRQCIFGAPFTCTCVNCEEYKIIFLSFSCSCFPILSCSSFRWATESTWTKLIRSPPNPPPPSSSANETPLTLDSCLSMTSSAQRDACSTKSVHERAMTSLCYKSTPALNTDSAFFYWASEFRMKTTHKSWHHPVACSHLPCIFQSHLTP